MSDPVCTQFVECIYEFQTLVTGIFATLIAAVTAGIIYLAAHLPVKAERGRQKEAERRRLRLRSLEISEELSLLSKRARQGQGTVRTHKAANAQVTEETRKKMKLCSPAAIHDWEFMSLLPETVTKRFLQLNGIIEDHNFDVARAGGAFGDDNFGRQIIDRLETIQNRATELSDTFLGIADA